MSPLALPRRALRHQHGRCQHKCLRPQARQKVRLRCNAVAEGVSQSIREDLDNFISWACANGKPKICITVLWLFRTRQLFFYTVIVL